MTAPSAHTSILRVDIMFLIPSSNLNPEIMSRVDRSAQLEYLVVANNAETSKTATFATYTPSTAFKTIFGGQGGVSSSKTGQVTVTVGSGVYLAFIGSLLLMIGGLVARSQTKKTLAASAPMPMAPQMAPPPM